MVNGNANNIQPMNVIGPVSASEAIATALGPVPIGVAIPPRSAPSATPTSNTLRSRSLSSRLLKAGRRHANISAAAAIFDNHIERNAVIKITKSRSFLYESPDMTKAYSIKSWSRP